jgi:hypothetical protein
MTRAQANRLAEGDRVKTRELAGTVVGATRNCVSIQWDGRTARNLPHRRRAEYQQGGRSKMTCGYAQVSTMDRA